MGRSIQEVAFCHPTISSSQWSSLIIIIIELCIPGAHPKSISAVEPESLRVSSSYSFFWKYLAPTLLSELSEKRLGKTGPSLRLKVLFLTNYMFQLPPAIEYFSPICTEARKSTLDLLDDIERRAICQINKPQLTDYLQPL